jgi:RNA polymerase sigma-70 factor (ECF subfamily)
MGRNEVLEESVLILRCQTGDREALAELIGRYYRRLRYFIGHLAEGPEMIDDVLQDTWLRVIGKLGALRNAESFAAWLYRIARNTAYEHLRRRGRTCEFRDDLEIAGEEPEEAFTPADAARIHDGLKELQPAHREILVLRFFEDMAYQQMAEVLGCGLNTVKTRLHYAKRALRKVMEEKNEQER